MNHTPDKPKPITLPSLPATSNEEDARRQAAQAKVNKRWLAKSKSKEELESMDDNLLKKHIGALRDELTTASQILQRRIDRDSSQPTCYVCGRVIANGLPVQTTPFKSDQTGLWENRFWCSAECVAMTNIRKQGGDMPVMNYLVK